MISPRVGDNALAAMVAAQKLNAQPHQPVFGIVSNGKVWEFGSLLGDRFTHQVQAYTIYDLDRLFAAINDVLAQCVAVLARSEYV